MNSFQTLTSYQTEGRRTVVLTFVATLLLVSFSISTLACKSKAETPAVNYTRIPDGVPQNSYADVVARVAPAVVTIHANKRVRQPQQFPFFDDPFGFGNRNRDQQQQQPRERSEEHTSELQ